MRTYELRFTEGSVSGLHEPISYDGGPEIDAMVTDSAINGGNSGGPALDAAGRVVGLVSGQLLWVVGSDADVPAQGQGYIIPAADLASNLARWRARPGPAAGVLRRSLRRRGRRAVHRGGRLVRRPGRRRHRPFPARPRGGHLNTGEETVSAAWQVFTAGMQRRLGSVDQWSERFGHLLLEGISIQEVSGGDAAKVARTLLVTEQTGERGHDGQTCSIWVMDYGLTQADGGWLIDSAKSPQGPPTACSIASPGRGASNSRSAWWSRSCAPATALEPRPCRSPSCPAGVDTMGALPIGVWGERDAWGRGLSREWVEVPEDQRTLTSPDL